MTIPNESEAP